MPTKFVQNVAKRTGTSVEHAEKVWHDAKQAVKKGKRQGSWYWGKVVNTFKRMMGIKEHISFSEFKEILESDQGQNKNDQAERAMIHKIVELAHAAGLMKGGVKTEANLEKAYDFLESDWGGRLWDKHYELFSQLSPSFEGPFDKRRYGDFKREAVAWFKAWQNGRKLPADVEPLPKLHESQGFRYRFGMDGWPDKIKLKGPYVLVKSPDSSEHHVVWNVQELFGGDKVSTAYASVTYGRDYHMIWTVRPGANTLISLSEREDFENVPEDEVPQYIEKFKDWVRNVFDDMRSRGLLEALHPETIDSFNRIVLYPVESWPHPGWKGSDIGSVFTAFDLIFGNNDWYHRYNIDTKELETQIINGRKIEIYYNKKVKPKLDVMKKLGIKIDHLSDYHPEHDIDDDVNEDKKEDGVKKSYVAGLNREEKAEMKREIKRFSKMDNKDKAAYPDDWTADQKYKERLKKKGKKLPKSSHTKEFERRYGR